MKYLHQSDYETLQEEASIAFAESGADREYDSNREQMEFDFISNAVGSDEWEVIPDLRVTTGFEQFNYANDGRARGGTIVRNCLTTIHNVAPEEVECLTQQHGGTKARYRKTTKRLYIRTRVVTLKLSQSQWRTHLLNMQKEQPCSN